MSDTSRQADQRRCCGSEQSALEYFELAAKLGDVDAQAEAGALYAAGKGCKKDLKKAAMYYRMAVSARLVDRLLQPD